MDGRMMRDGEWVPRDYKNFDNGNKTSLVSLDTQIHRVRFYSSSTFTFTNLEYASIIVLLTLVLTSSMLLF